MDTELGQKWRKKFYDKIIRSMKYSFDGDELARDTLSNLLSLKTRRFDYQALTSGFAPTAFLVISSSRSLVSTLRHLAPDLGRENVTIIAADGAADQAVNTVGAGPTVVVSDLDSCSRRLLIEQSTERWLVAHAHGDNINRLLNIVPVLGEKIIGSTQTYPTCNLVNTGGFMDGDRACYLAACAGSRIIAFAGFEWRSKSTVKARKLEWSKRSLEFLISECPKTSFVEITDGEPAVYRAEVCRASDFRRRFLS